MVETATQPLGSPRIERLADIAHLSITAMQSQDYFSDSREAEAFATTEGVNLDSLHRTGHEDTYTAVPRQYPPNLRERLYETFVSLASEEPKLFLHIDRYAVTMGRTSEQPQDLKIAKKPSTGQCSLRLSSCDFVQYRTMPQTEEEPQERTDEPIELPLGRNILVKHSGHNEYSQALRDGLRDWEKILVTSPTMIESYLVACLNTYEVIAYSGRGRAQLAQRRGKALGSALGIYLDYK